MKLEMLLSTKIFLVVGLVGMFLLAMIRRHKYQLNYIQLILSLFLVFVAGLSGLSLMFYIENGFFGGISFFGTILLGPILLFPLCLIFRLPYIKTLNYVAPCVLIAQMFMKYNCYIVDCCGGNEFFKSVCVIPLQIVELLWCVLVFIVLLVLENKYNKERYLYAVLLIMYGAGRLVLNSFRYGLKPFFFTLPAGHLWSIVAFVSGLILLFVLIRSDRNEKDRFRMS